MGQLWIFVIVLNSASAFFRLVLTAFKISTCRLKEGNNRATGEGKQEYDFQR